MRDRLQPGEVLSSLSSQDGRFALYYQGDGNVVLYRTNGEALWASRTAGTTVGQAVMQDDGSFAVYDAAGAPVFSTETSGHPGASLVVQNDGNLVLYGPDGVALWSSGTVQPDGGPISEAPESHPPPTPPSIFERLTQQPVAPVQAAGGGCVETAASTAVRPRFTRAQIATFLPERGAFMFPAPYGTRAFRLTNESDGTVRPIGMSYWPNCNNSAGRGELLVLLSLDDVLTLFTVNKTSGDVQKETLPYRGTGEGCYWSLTDHDTFYVGEGSNFLRYNVATRKPEVVFTAPGPFTQCHSSADGRAHSLTLDGAAAVFRDGVFTRFPARGDYDECQIDKSGRWLVIKEGERTNRIADLATGREWTITAGQLSVGHSDMGWGYMIGEDNQTNPGGVLRRWDFTPDGPVDAGPVYHMDWTPMTRYVSHCNAVQGRPEDQFALVSSSYNGDRPRANELVKVKLDGSLNCVVAGPNLTDLTASGGGEEYWRKTRANLDPAGQFACFSGNMGTERMDVFVLQVP